MKKRLINLILFQLCCSFCFAYSEPIQSSEHKKDRVELYPDIPKKERPGKRANWFIKCEYSVGHLVLVLPTYVNSVQITLGDEMFPIWTGVVNKSYPETNVPYTIGETKITCEDDLGRKYVGNTVFPGLITYN